VLQLLLIPQAVCALVFSPPTSGEEIKAWLPPHSGAGSADGSLVANGIPMSPAVCRMPVPLPRALCPLCGVLPLSLSVVSCYLPSMTDSSNGKP
jgi:hypothetical protein